MLPSWIKSRNCRPRLVYFLAMEMTRRRFASTISFFAWRASRSPFCTMCSLERKYMPKAMRLAAVGTPVPGAPHLQVVQTPAPPAAPPAATPFRAPGTEGEEGEQKDPGEAAAESDYDEDDMENSLSLAAIEAELKPKVVETFDTIADSFKRLRRLQEQDIEFRLKNSSLSPAQERKQKSDNPGVPPGSSRQADFCLCRIRLGVDHVNSRGPKTGDDEVPAFKEWVPG
jgi:hypothetical protein